ncbi:MAG: hypothetical protein Q9228_001552 [Teloschistes exilis]
MLDIQKAVGEDAVEIIVINGGAGPVGFVDQIAVPTKTQRWSSQITPPYRISLPLHPSRKVPDEHPPMAPYGSIWLHGYEPVSFGIKGQRVMHAALAAARTATLLILSFLGPTREMLSPSTNQGKPPAR